MLVDFSFPIAALLISTEQFMNKEKKQLNLFRAAIIHENTVLVSHPINNKKLKVEEK